MQALLLLGLCVAAAAMRAQDKTAGLPLDAKCRPPAKLTQPSPCATGLYCSMSQARVQKRVMLCHALSCTVL
jgi:hypothetical protein